MLQLPISPGKILYWEKKKKKGKNSVGIIHSREFLKRAKDHWWFQIFFGCLL